MERDTICLVEDKKTIRLFYENYLTDKGFDVVTFPNRALAQAELAVEKTSLFILDIVLEGEIQGGYLLANHIRSISQTVPIIFLTDEKNEEVPGLNKNVNDFIIKGYTDDYMNRFYARISNHIRIYKEQGHQTSDHQNAITQTSFSEGNLRIDLIKSKVQWRLQPVKLSSLDIAILYCLASQPGITVGYNAIRKSIEKPNMENSALQVHVSNIRKALKEIDINFDDIVTQSKVGYMWKRPTDD